MKIDINVSRKMTINAGNYSSISPSVSISVKDIDVSKIDEVYSLVDPIIGSMLLLEIDELIGTSEYTRNLSDFKEYVGENRTDIINMIKESKSSLEVIKKNG